MFSFTAAMAEENVLQTIEIEPVKDTYNIVLVSDKVVDVKKTVEASNKITLSMKGIRASKTLNTVYNNVSNIDTVMVEPQGNGLSIYFQAENAAKATVSFDALSAPIAINKTKNLKLNNPIESYAPIYTEDLQSEKTSSMFDRLKASSTVAAVKTSVKDNGAEAANKFVGFGLITLLVVAVSRLFKRKEPEMRIGLSQSLTSREIDMYKNIQNPLAQNFEKPFSTVNYGLNAYQRENRNPYESQSQSVQFHNPRLQNYSSHMYTEPVMPQQVTRPVAQAVTTPTQPQVKKMTTPVNTAPVNQSNPNVDNLKFLESMTAIYEKSGRHDLARGLKASLNKNNLK